MNEMNGRVIQLAFTVECPYEGGWIDDGILPDTPAEILDLMDQPMPF